MTLPKGTHLITVPGTGSRELNRIFQINGNQGGRFIHVHEVPPGMEIDRIIVPVRHPYDIVLTYIKRGERPIKLEGYCQDMDVLLQKHEHIIVPVDIPGLRDERLRQYATNPEWVQTGKTEGTPKITQAWCKVLVSIWKLELFGDYCD